MFQRELRGACAGAHLIHLAHAEHAHAAQPHEELGLRAQRERRLELLHLLRVDAHGHLAQVGEALGARLHRELAGAGGALPQLDGKLFERGLRVGPADREVRHLGVHAVGEDAQQQVRRAQLLQVVRDVCDDH